MAATMTTAIEVTPDTPFDFAARVDELRCHPDEVLRAKLAEVRREQQRWRVEELG
jgi:hypothetical protein